MKVLRIYFTTYDSSQYHRVLSFLKENLNYDEIIEHPSSILPEFHYIEIRGLKNNIVDIKNKLNLKFNLKFKIDEIEVVMPSHTRKDKS